MRFVRSKRRLEAFLDLDYLFSMVEHSDATRSNGRSKESLCNRSFPLSLLTSNVCRRAAIWARFTRNVEGDSVGFMAYETRARLADDFHGFFLTMRLKSGSIHRSLMMAQMTSGLWFANRACHD